MSDFGDMIREALLGEETFDSGPGKETVRAALEKFDRRMWTVRVMSWSGTALMTALAIWMVVLIFGMPDDASPKNLALYVSGLAFALLAIGMIKGWWFLMQNHFAVMKEIKRTQLMILERQPPSD
ncbi:MAG: DUF6768 family protein [Planctomycetota bacterium]